MFNMWCIKKDLLYLNEMRNRCTGCSVRSLLYHNLQCYGTFLSRSFALVELNL